MHRFGGPRGNVAGASEAFRTVSEKLFGKYLKASRACFFGGKRRPIERPSTPFGSFPSLDSGPSPIFQTVSENEISEVRIQDPAYPWPYATCIPDRTGSASSS